MYMYQTTITCMYVNMYMCQTTITCMYMYVNIYTYMYKLKSSEKKVTTRGNAPCISTTGTRNTLVTSTR